MQALQRAEGQAEAASACLEERDAVWQAELAALRAQAQSAAAEAEQARAQAAAAGEAGMAAGQVAEELARLRTRMADLQESARRSSAQACRALALFWALANVVAGHESVRASRDHIAPG